MRFEPDRFQQFWQNVSSCGKFYLPAVTSIQAEYFVICANNFRQLTAAAATVLPAAVPTETTAASAKVAGEALEAVVCNEAGSGLIGCTLFVRTYRTEIRSSWYRDTILYPTFTWKHQMGEMVGPISCQLRATMSM